MILNLAALLYIDMVWNESAIRLFALKGVHPLSSVVDQPKVATFQPRYVE